VSLAEQQARSSDVLSGIFLLVAVFFIYRSYLRMRIVAAKG